MLLSAPLLPLLFLLLGQTPAVHGSKLEDLTREIWSLALGRNADIIDQDASGSNDKEEEAKKFLAEYNREYGKLLNLQTIADWNYNTNITKENALAAKVALLKVSEYNGLASQTANTFNTTNFSYDTIRQLGNVGSYELDKEELEEITDVIAKMGEIYGSSCVTMKEGGECLQLEPGLTEIMESSTDYSELLTAWKGWRTVVGRQMRPLYIRYVELKNKMSKLNGFTDLGDEWRARYETPDLESDVMSLYTQLEPLYREVHAYIRRKLYERYGSEHISLSGPLPAHLLTDMWGRFWSGLYKLVEPFSGKPAIDPSPKMKEQNYTVRKMYQTADDFYASLGLLRVPDSFWTLSMLKKPENREVICHATAWDFYDAKDFRIKMCTRDFNFDDLNTIHHELGHIQYYQQYKSQPQVYRDGANDGFHEAIGELMAMAGATPSHLYSIGLLDDLVLDDELDLNFLMRQALITVTTLPYHLVNDLWRWRAFRGEYNTSSWNDEYWALKEKIVGVKAPTERTKEDLDPPTIFHICQDYDMIRYFTRTILQFQFWDKLCEISGHEGPLHRCDFSGSHEAGEALSRMLRLGSSKPWQDALEQLTGERKMNAEPILRFFEPLYQWLKQTNEQNGDSPGWE